MLRTFIVAGSLVAAGSLLAADVFYETRLRAGREALVAGKHVEAAENLRIACFGMLDSPKALSPCLAMLAVAQQGVGRTSDVEATLSRFVELESRYPSYASAQLDLGIRREFEPLLRQRVPAETLATLSAFRVPQAQVSATNRPKATPAPDVPVVAAPVQKPVVTGTAPATQATPPPAVTAKKNEPAPAAKNEVLPVPKVTTTQPGATQKPVPPATRTNEPAKPSATPATQTPPASGTASATKQPAVPATKQPAASANAQPKVPATSAPATTEKPAAAKAPVTRPAAVSADPIGDARKLISDRKPAEATRLLENAVAQSPARRDLRLALLQSAVFSSEWKTALAQVEPLKPFKDSEAAYAFYASVALYESGRRAEARALLTPVVPRLAHSTYVDNYVAKITQ